MAPGPRSRVVAFVGVATVCVLAPVAYGVAQGARFHEQRSHGPRVAHTAPTSYDAEPRIVFRNTAIGSSYGVVATVPLSDPEAPRALSDVPCDRVDATRTVLSCLRVQRGVVTSYQWLDLAPDLSQRDVHPLRGLPSRTRLSADGRLEASTSFVAGHSYMTTGFSTATEIREVGGRSFGNLERFSLSIDGHRVTARDRNIWGVTFASDDHTFYATAATGGTTYLVRGDLSTRTLTAVRAGPECPSLSPDGTRVAYKLARSQRGPRHWDLAVLDLRTGRQRVLRSETHSVDDQVEWLDDSTLLYGLPRADQAGVSDVWALAADGSGGPRRLLSQAWSPAVVR
jgi:hypothetical protein